MSSQKKTDRWVPGYSTVCDECSLLTLSKTIIKHLYMLVFKGANYCKHSKNSYMKSDILYTVTTGSFAKPCIVPDFKTIILHVQWSQIECYLNLSWGSHFMYLYVNSRCLMITIRVQVLYYGSTLVVCTCERSQVVHCSNLSLNAHT